MLPRLADTLRPSGLLIAVALPVIDLPRDVPVEAVSVVGHRLLGAAFRLERTPTGRRRYPYEASVRLMPVQDAVLTTRQVRAEAALVLPDVHVRRLPLRRCELRWRRPPRQPFPGDRSHPTRAADSTPSRPRRTAAVSEARPARRGRDGRARPPLPRHRGA